MVDNLASRPLSRRDFLKMGGAALAALASGCGTEVKPTGEATRISEHPDPIVILGGTGDKKWVMRRVEYQNKDNVFEIDALTPTGDYTIKKNISSDAAWQVENKYNCELVQRPEELGATSRILVEVKDLECVKRMEEAIKKESSQ